KETSLKAVSTVAGQDQHSFNHEPQRIDEIDIMEFDDDFLAQLTWFWHLAVGEIIHLIFLTTIKWFLSLISQYIRWKISDFNISVTLMYCARSESFAKTVGNSLFRCTVAGH
ncbi:hypothetical protein, partial [Brenneria corticis]